MSADDRQLAIHPLPLNKFPIKAGRNTITRPARAQFGGLFLMGGEQHATVRVADYVQFPIGAQGFFSSYPDLHGPIFTAPWTVEIVGPSSGWLMLWTDDDVEVTWEKDNG